MKLLVPGGCVSQNPSVGSVTSWLRQFTEELPVYLTVTGKSLTGDPVVLTGLVALSCLLPMGTTEQLNNSVTGEPAVSTGMVGAADLSVTSNLC